MPLIPDFPEMQLVSYYLHLFLQRKLPRKKNYTTKLRFNQVENIYAKSNEVKERDPNDTLIGDRLIQDFSPTGWQQEGEEDEEKEEVEDVLSGASRDLWVTTTKMKKMVMRPMPRMRMKTKTKKSPEGRSLN